jgi:hypothetical protein
MNRSFKVAKEPGEIPALFIEAWMKHDADFLASLFSEDAESKLSYPNLRLSEPV